MSQAPRLGTSCTRRDARHRIRRAGDDAVTLSRADGTAMRGDLLEVSDRGLSFGLDNPANVPGVGDEFPDARIELLGRIASGCVRIVHVTEEFGAGVVCGAEFTPACDADAETWRSVIADLAKRENRPGATRRK